MRINPPSFLTDLYRDFRDRRLILPAAALVLALIAVPVLLSESPSPPPPPAQTADIEATAATPAVLTENVTGIRNYRKRLNQLKRKNPFDQQFTGSASGQIADLGGALGGGGGPLGGGDPLGGGPPVSDGTDPGAPASPSGGGPDDASTPQREPADQGKPAEQRWLTWEVDLVFGPVGDAERYEGLRRLRLLPSRKNPIAALFGTGERGNRVAFAFSEDVAESSGDGRCAPSPSDCFFVILTKGEERRLTVQRDGEPEVTYRLKVLAINERIITLPRD